MSQVLHIQLVKNLRKSILRGNPWIYDQAIKAPKDLKESTLCKIIDHKKDFIAWGIYSPNSQLAVRMLSLEKKAPVQKDFNLALHKALAIRKAIYSDSTNCYRIINGEGDLLPGLVCDIYNRTAVVQFDGEGPYQFWDQQWLAAWILENTNCESVYYKPRHDAKTKAQSWGAKDIPKLIEVKENEIKLYVDIVNGQKTGFFIDQRENRNYLKSISEGKTVLNLFSYTGAFSVYAGAGGAKHVRSVDLSKDALELAHKNWLLNNLNPQAHNTLQANIFDELAEHKESYDIVICDPPSLAKAEKNKENAVLKYINCFALAAKKVNEGGHLILSSCSSHINFNDFMEIVTEALSKARRKGQILRFSGQGSDHPYPHACPQLRYLKFVDIIVS